VALGSLQSNSIGDEGVAAISSGLASVPQLQALKYAVAVCVLVVCLRRRDPVAQSVRDWGGSMRAGCVVGVRAGMPVCVWCDMCAWLRRWCRMVVCSLGWNNFGPEGAAAISRSLASVPQLQTLKYAVAVCVLVVWLRRRDPVAQSVRDWGGSMRAGCVGVRAGMPVCV
jgi:hypothetical protein